MCITKVDSYEYAGVLYPTEIAAVDAALGAVLGPLANSPPAEVKRSVIEQAEKIIDLLTRHKRITDALPKTAAATRD